MNSQSAAAMSGLAEHESPTPSERLKKELTLLQAQRDALELEADAIAGELNSPGVNGEPPVGVKGSLVDSDGFPLPGFDLFNVRGKRQRWVQLPHHCTLLLSTVCYLILSHESRSGFAGKYTAVM